MKQSEYDVLVIGGGAAGMMAAGVAASRGKRVVLVEQNKRLGEKLRISGGGRCNITNAELDEQKLLSYYGDSKQFLHSVFAQFGVKDTFAFFESRGLPLKVEANNRAFPETENATNVVNTLEDFLREGKVEIRKGVAVDRITAKSGRIQNVTLKNGEIVTARTYILATGGLSHPETGSTGDGFGWLRKLGHAVQDPTPTIVPLKVRNTWVKKLSGKTLPNVKITFFVNDTKKFSKAGNILLTHFGVSGPTILNSAGEVADLLQEGLVEARIDLYSSMNIGELDQHITTIFDQNKNKNLKNAFKEIVPTGTSDVILSLLSGIDPETKVHSVLKSDRRKIVDLLKALPLKIEGLMGFERAVVADGGVPLYEIDTRTMRSKKFENLYVTGDLLDIRRPTGGYSLQLAWTTGFVAGTHA